MTTEPQLSKAQLRKVKENAIGVVAAARHLLDSNALLFAAETRTAIIAVSKDGSIGYDSCLDIETLEFALTKTLEELAKRKTAGAQRIALPDGAMPPIPGLRTDGKA